MARATALVNSTSAACPRCAPSTNMNSIVIPAAPAIHSVSVLSWRVSGVFSFGVADSIPAIRPTSVSAPVAVTSITPLPCVTGVCMKAMLTRSPGVSAASARTVASLEAGTLSPVSADSSICSELAATMRPSAGTSSPAVIRTTSPTTISSAEIWASLPSRRTRAVDLTIALSAFIALSALPSWRSPTTALSTVMAASIVAVVHSWMASETTAAPTRMSCM